MIIEEQAIQVSTSRIADNRYPNGSMIDKVKTDLVAGRTQQSDNHECLETTMYEASCRKDASHKKRMNREKEWQPEYCNTGKNRKTTVMAIPLQYLK